MIDRVIVENQEITCNSEFFHAVRAALAPHGHTVFWGMWPKLHVYAVDCTGDAEDTIINILDQAGIAAYVWLDGASDLTRSAMCAKVIRQSLQSNLTEVFPALRNHGCVAPLSARA